MINCYLLLSSVRQQLLTLLGMLSSLFRFFRTFGAGLISRQEARGSDFTAASFADRGMERRHGAPALRLLGKTLHPNAFQLLVDLRRGELAPKVRKNRFNCRVTAGP
jgi:hypothetical protein